MPDISMCDNKDCALAWKCRRSIATPSKWQAYASFKPKEDGTCDAYWPVQKETKDE